MNKSYLKSTNFHFIWSAIFWHTYVAAMYASTCVVGPEVCVIYCSFSILAGNVKNAGWKEHIWKLYFNIPVWNVSAFLWLMFVKEMVTELLHGICRTLLPHSDMLREQIFSASSSGVNAPKFVFLFHFL
jgi:hypothetical protein